MPKNTINQLIAQATDMLDKLEYCTRCSKAHISEWASFQRYCDDKGKTVYSTELKDGYIATITNKVPPYRPSTLERKISAIKMLDLLATRDTWTKGDLNPLPKLLPEFEKFLDEQDAYLVKTGHSECSRNTMRGHVSFLLRYFMSVGVTRLAEIDNSRITSYLLTLNGHAKSTVRGELSRLRMFLTYLQMFGYITDDLAHRVPGYRLGGDQSMVKIWESDEISQVLETVDRSNPKGKRDYAVISIAAELGVRSRDICNLKLTDIDWDACSISFVQSKTRNPNCLPLSEKLGLAIIDYLRVRPKTDSEYLFVSFNPPYEKMKSFSSSFGRYVSRSGVKVAPEAHHGLHSLRASVATKLLSADVSPDVIFSFLGHSDRNTLDHYIRLDIENLRSCALSFEDGELI